MRALFEGSSPPAAGSRRQLAAPIGHRRAAVDGRGGRSTVTPAPKKARRPKAGSKTAIKRKEEAAQKKDEHVWAAAVEAYRLGHKSASKVLRNTDGTAFESLGHGNRNAVNRVLKWLNNNVDVHGGKDDIEGFARPSFGKAGQAEALLPKELEQLAEWCAPALPLLPTQV